jgi:hypothetical protein
VPFSMLILFFLFFDKKDSSRLILAAFPSFSLV